MANIIKPVFSKNNTSARPRQQALRVAILAYAGCMGTQVFGMAEVLRLASDIALTHSDARRVTFDIQVVSLHGRSVTIAGGNRIVAQRPAGPVDLLIVPGLEICRSVDWDTALAPLQRELAFIRKTFAAGTPVASVCVGAFLLGEAGLLAGRKATTAWLFAPALAQRYPGVHTDGAAVLVEDAGITTTGAVSSAFDLAIHLVKHTLGAAVATATARVCLLPDQRPSQSPFVDQQLLQANPSPYAQWFATRLARPFHLDHMAKAFCVSSSTLMRRVKADTGLTPLALLQQARVERAKHLLHTTSWSLARIVEAVGYSDVASFTRLFVRRVGEPPARYRRRART